MLRDLSPPAVIDALEWILFGLFASFACIPLARVDHGPDMMRVITGLPHELLNGMFRARLNRTRIEDAIDEVLDELRSRDLPLTWYTGPSTDPPDLGTFLERRGLVHAGDLTGMAIDLRSLLKSVPSPEELTFERVEDNRTLKEWVVPLALGFEFPASAAEALFKLFRGFGFGSDSPFRHYLGRWRGHRVATFTMFLGAGVAGTHVAVVPVYRRWGIGAAITLAPLQDASALGYCIAVAQASEVAFGFHGDSGTASIAP